MTSDTPVTPLQIQQGHVLALFAFDIGYEVALDRVRELLTTTPVQPLSRKKQTPNYLQYSTAPQMLHLGATQELLLRPGHIQATIFEFGAVSIAYRWPIALQNEPLPLARLPEISFDLSERKLDEHARELAESLLQRLQPALTKPGMAPLVEDYFLFVIERFDRPLSAAELLQQHGAALAQTLRFEPRPFSPEMQEEALSHRISYYADDLVLLDWNAAVVYDADYEDTVNVLELLNVELLEARFIDGQLDKRLAEYAGLIRRPRASLFPLRTPYKRAIEHLAEARIESSLLGERVENTLKLIGNLYLARLHALGARRFFLHEWQQQITRKLDIASEFYQVLSDRVHSAQSQTLELIVILLILVEVVMGFMRH
jgi:hypothetical protein